MKNTILLFNIILIIIMGALPLTSMERSDLLKDHADVIIRVSDGPAFMKAISDSSLGTLWNSPQMKPFLANQSLEDALIKSILLDSEKYKSPQRALDINRGILELLKGEILMGVHLGEEEGSTSFYIMATMNAENYAKILDLSKREAKLVGDQTVDKQQRFQGIEITETITESDEGKSTQWTAFCGDTYLNSTEREWLESCIVRLKKESPRSPRKPPSLQIEVTNGFFKRIAAPTDEPPEKEQKTDEGKGPDTVAMLRAIGIGEVGSARMEWLLKEEKSEFNLVVERAGENKGLWTLFSRDPVPMNHYLGYVPEDVASYQVMRINMDAFWQELPNFLNAGNPQGATQFRLGVQMTSKMLGIDIYRDFIGNLDTLLTTFSRLEGLQELTMYAWQLKQPEAMEKTLSKIFAEGGWIHSHLQTNLETLELHGHRVYTIKLPQATPPADEGKTSPQQPQVNFIPYSISVIDGDLAVGALPLMRNYIGGTMDKSGKRQFYRSRLFNNMIRRIPDRVNGYGFFNIYQWIKPLVNFFKTIRKPAIPPAADKDAKPGAGRAQKDSFNEFLRNLQFNRLPSPDFITEHFGPILSYFRFEGDRLSIRWEFHYTRPNKEKK